MNNLYITPNDRTTQQPININHVEKKYNSIFIGDFCIRTTNGWSEIPFAIFYTAEPSNPNYSSYFGLGLINNHLHIVDGKSAFDDQIIGIIANNGEIIFSRYRHNYVVSKDESVFIDGGRDYVRSSISGNGLVNLKMIEGVFHIHRLQTQPTKS
jgi:hypothetical protein